MATGTHGVIAGDVMDWSGIPPALGVQGRAASVSMRHLIY